MRTLDLGIVIPTLNEQRYIGVLLDSLSVQTRLPAEVYIVDAQSKDTTKEEVLKRKKAFPFLHFLTIPKKTIARQRNYGARQLHTKHILFLDADMICPTEDTLAQLYKKILRKKPDAATTYVKPFSNDLSDKVLYGIANGIAAVMQWIKPSGTTMNLYVKREVFEELGGFDEEVKVGEDFEFLSRLGQQEKKFMFFWQPTFYTSVRRLDHEGRMQFVLKLTKATIYTKIKGYKSNPMQYKFGHFSKRV